MVGPVSSDPSSSPTPITYVNTSATAGSTSTQSTIQISGTGTGTIPVPSLNPLPLPTMSLADYLNTVFTNLNTAKQQLFKDQVATDTSTTNQLAGIALSALNNLGLLQALHAELVALVTALNTASANVTAQDASVNTTIDTYNNGTGQNVNFPYTGPNGTQYTINVTDNGVGSDTSEQNTLYAAYQNYVNALNTYNSISNPSQSDTQTFQQAQDDYSAAEETYNVYVQIRDPDIAAYNAVAAPADPTGQSDNYNTQVAIYNNAAAGLNAAAAAAGIAPLSPLISLTPATLLVPTTDSLNAPTFLTVDATNNNVDHVQDPSAPSANTATEVQNYYNAIVANLNQELKDAENGVDTTLYFQNLQKTFIQFLSSVTQPNAYIQKKNNAETTASGSGAVSGSTPSMGNNLSNPDLLQAITQGFQDLNLLLKAIPKAQISSSANNSFAAALLQFVGLAAALPAAAILSDKFAVLGSGDVTLNVALLSQSLLKLNGSLSTDDVLNQLDAALKLANPTLSDEEIKGIGLGLEVAVVTSLVGLIGTQINNPNLVAQLTALAAQPITGTLSLSSLLSNLGVNGLVVSNLKASILAANPKLTDAEAEAEAEAIVEAAALKSSDGTAAQQTAQFQADVQASLIQQGLTTQQAQDASIQASSILNGEIAFQANQQTQTSQDNIRQDILDASLAESIKEAGLAQSDDAAYRLAQQSTSSLFGGGQQLTNAQIQAQLQTNLGSALPTANSAQISAILSGTVIEPSAVPSAAAAPVLGQTSSFAAVTPTAAPTTTSAPTPTRAQFSSTVATSTINATAPSVGVAKGTELASSLVTGLVGSADASHTQASALSLLTDIHHQINQLSTASAKNAAATTISDYYKGQFDYTGSEAMKPGKALVNSFNPIYHAGPKPTAGSGQAEDQPTTTMILG